MTEESKYYIPEIDEMCIGTEYYLYDATYGGWSEKGWVVGKYELYQLNEDSFKHYGTQSDIENEWDDILIALKEGRLFLKHLDQEDIEELGWSYDNNSEPIPARQDIPFEMPLAFSFDTQDKNGKCWILYLFSDGVVWIYYIKDCGGEGYIFKGRIKNKSELKKVMKMSGVYPVKL